MRKFIHKETLREFTGYLVPSVIGSISIAALIIIDGIFIGRGIGGEGLAALSTSVPVFTLYAALGLMLGMGGGTIASIYRGSGDENNKNRIFTLGLIMTLVTGMGITVFQQVFIDDLTRFLGAPEKLFSTVKNYIQTLGFFATFYIGAQFLSCFIRNDSNPKLSMTGMAVSGAINIILDYYFIFVLEWGMTGAALATCLAQLGFIGTLATHFASSKNTLRINPDCLDLSEAVRIIRAGFPTFLTDISNGAVIFSFNAALYRVAGETGVSAYGIILNFNYLVFLSYIGIAQAAQPMVSLDYGRGKMDRVAEVLRLALVISSLLSMVTFLGVGLFKHEITGIYSRDPEIMTIAAKGMPLFFSATLFMGINIIVAAFFQAVECPAIASAINFFKGIGFIVIGLLILPGYFGIRGIWLVLLFAEGLTLSLFLVFYMASGRGYFRKRMLPAESR